MGKITGILDSITGKKQEPSSTVVQATPNGGKYFLFKTTSGQEYLNFLEGFDETKYKIIDISISIQGTAFVSTEIYMVTYKKKPPKLPK